LIGDPPAGSRDRVIRPGFDADLDAISDASKGAREWIAKLEDAERRRTGIRPLKVGFNRVFGYYIEVSHSNAQPLPDDFVRKQTLTGGERYITPELKEKEAIVLSAQERIAARELEILHALAETVAANAPSLRASAQAIGRIDALLSLALAAAEHGWRRPEVNAGLELSIKAGRHPLVEQSAPAGQFVPNDLNLDPDGAQIAQAVVEFLHDAPKLGCRTLFATHYHELTALAERLPRVRNQRVEVLEDGDTVRFLHRVVPGGADRSYGIHVAAVAGLPAGVIARARDVLADLERQRPLEPPEFQLGLPIEMASDPLRKELEDIDPASLSPLEALQK